MSVQGLSVTRMIASLGTVTIVAAGLLGGVYSLTRDPIAEAERNKRTEAIQAVLPEFDNDVVADAVTLTLEGDDRPVTIYPAKRGGIPAGAAIQTYSPDGFSGEITIMVGIGADGHVTGYEVLSHAETPGLGAKMGDWFRDSRGHRSVIGLDPQNASFRVVKDPGGEIDGITAATITSRAFLGAIRRASAAYAIYTDSIL